MNIITLKNTIVQILYWICNMCVAAFTTGYLSNYGFNELQIGLIMTISAIITIFINFYIDEAMDYLVFYHLKRTIIFNYIICLSLAGLFLIIGKANLLTLGLFALICSLTTHNQRLINILCARQKHQYYLTDGNRPANYGLLGYGLSTLAMGYAISNSVVTIIIPAYIIFSIISALAVVLLLKDETQQQPVIDVRLEFHKAIDLIYRNKLFIVFLSASCLSAVGSMAAIKYLVRVVNSLGGNAFHHSIALMIQTLITIPISLKSKKIIKKYDPEKLLLTSFIFSFLKIFLLLVANNLVLVYLSMACSIFGYGLFGFSSASFTKLLNKQGDFAIAHKLALIASSFGLGPLIGGIVGGYIMQYGNLQLLLIVCCILTLSAVLIQIIVAKEYRKTV